MNVCHKILETFKIEPTPQRVTILKLITAKGNKPFSTQELKNDAKSFKPTIANSTIVTTLQLFKRRKLIRIEHIVKSAKAGRSTTYFVYK